MKVVEANFVTQCYVSLENDDGYIIKYYLFAEPDLCEDLTYGINVEKIDSTGVSGSSCSVSKDKHFVEQLIHCLAKNFVSPVSLDEIVSDLKCVK